MNMIQLRDHLKMLSTLATPGFHTDASPICRFPCRP